MYGRKERYESDVVAQNESTLEKTRDNSNIELPKGRFDIMAVYTIAISLNAMTLGWDTGTIGHIVTSNGFQQNYVHEKLSSTMVGITISCFNFGCIIGCLVLGHLWKAFGYKKSVYIVNLIYFLGTVVQILMAKFTRNIWLTLLGRTMCGTQCGALCVLLPKYVYQLVLASHKNVLLSFLQTAVCISIFAGSFANWLVKDKFIILWYCQVVFVFLNTIVLLPLPEPPSYYLSENNYSKAERVIERLYVLDYEKTASMYTRNFQQSEIEQPQCRVFPFRVMIPCVLLMIFQQLTGINYFFYYGSMAFLRLGINYFFINALMTGLNLVGSLISNAALSWFCVRALLLAGSALLCCFFVLYTTFNLTSTPVSPYIVIVATCCFILIFAVTWGPAPGILVARYAENSSTLLALAVSVNFFSNCVITTVSPLLFAKLGFPFTIIFIGGLLCLFLYVMLCVH